MSRFGKQLIIACLLLFFGVFYGLDMAKSGIERVNGPLEQEISPAESVVIEAPQENKGQEISNKEESSESKLSSESPRNRVISSDKPIHRVADKTGDLLHISVRSGIELVVSLFEEVVH